MLPQTIPFMSEIRSFNTDDARWDAIRARRPEADGAFVYAVRTTGVYCRPACRSRLPLRKNVLYFETADAAHRAGFRACRRCKPDSAAPREPHLPAMLRACRVIDESPTPPPLAELARATGLSPSHFQRVFKRVVGVSPKQYAIGRRLERLRSTLRRSSRVTDAIHAAGFQCSSRAYDRSTNGLGETPTAYARRGRGLTLRWTTFGSRLGRVLVAATRKGVCFIALGLSESELVQRLREAFPLAQAERGGANIDRYAASVRRFADDSSLPLDLPLDIIGTAFQQRVWRELRRIPSGTTRSYKEVARQLGDESASRAVAAACASNPVALAIPCHRVVRSGGQLAGYRWGIERKRQLLDRERQAAAAVAASRA
ncbi:MAG: bifunctional DNA-binding transcriptional regulator/O6-methylguanine-DNA methyltransferase Ada [Phycisphaerales bacterium]|nr:bifunctional DNA-binding transcriptional regulator/O6-methylguanine-DNA methyltransferase Ada [Phycisphaerales bacterium]